MEGLAPLGSTPLYHTKQPGGQKRATKATRPVGTVYHTDTTTPLIMSQRVKYAAVGSDDPVRAVTMMKAFVHCSH